MPWNEVAETRVESLSDRINDIDIVGDRGWAVSSFGFLYRWRGASAAEATLLGNMHARCVGFAMNGTTGWVGCLVTPASDVRLKKTVDGGQTWEDVNGLPKDPVEGLCGLQVLDRVHAYACGTFKNKTQPGLVKTTDGTHWSSVKLPKLACLTDLHFWDVDHGLLVGGKGNPTRAAIVLTDDGGARWRHARLPVGLPADGICWKVFFLNKMVGFVSISQFRHPADGTPALVLKTADAGESWQIVRVMDEGDWDLQGVGFRTARYGWAGNRNGETLATTDAGATWSVDGGLTNVNRIIRTRRGFYAAGDAVYVLSR
jgi:photosystem II stability/assembly factor-like uncharacterized protein